MVAVADNGPGVPEAKPAQVAEEKFRQGGMRSGRPPGTGSGSISRQIVEHPGERIWLESDRRRVPFRLPFRRRGGGRDDQGADR